MANGQGTNINWNNSIYRKKTEKKQSLKKLHKHANITKKHANITKVTKKIKIKSKNSDNSKNTFVYEKHILLRSPYIFDLLDYYSRHQTILSQYSISITPENVRKPQDFWRFQGV